MVCDQHLSLLQLCWLDIRRSVWPVRNSAAAIFKGLCCRTLFNSRKIGRWPMKPLKVMLAVVKVKGVVWTPAPGWVSSWTSPLNPRPCHVGWPQGKATQGKHKVSTSDKGGGSLNTIAGVCVCLSVSKIIQKRVDGFGWNVACRQMSGHGRTD